MAASTITSISGGAVSAIIDSSTDVSTCALPNNLPGSLINKGSATVYIKWNAATLTPATTEALDYYYLAAGDSVRIPHGVSSFAHATTASTAKLLFIAEGM